MAFAETAQDRRVLSGACPVTITLSEDCKAGDCLGISSGTWVVSAHTSAEEPVLVAGTAGISGQKITAYPVAIVECITTSSNVGTLGEVVALSDTGTYKNAASNQPDVGYVASVGSDSLTAILVVYPGVVNVDTPRT